MRKRVVVVDDDDISRRGLTELLADRPELIVAGSLVHDEALEWDTE
jgi:DNA-binding NarL/FixJ family response regulator